MRPKTGSRDKVQLPRPGTPGSPSPFHLFLPLHPSSPHSHFWSHCPLHPHPGPSVVPWESCDSQRCLLPHPPACVTHAGGPRLSTAVLCMGVCHPARGKRPVCLCGPCGNCCLCNLTVVPHAWRSAFPRLPFCHKAPCLEGASLFSACPPPPQSSQSPDVTSALIPTQAAHPNKHPSARNSSCCLNSPARPLFWTSSSPEDRASLFWSRKPQPPACA